MERLIRQPAAWAEESVHRTDPVFAWKSYSRFVEVFPVRTGWLVLWGRYEQQGARRLLAGQRVYAARDGVRGRVAAAVADLTNDRSLVDEALMLFDRAALPEHRGMLPEPLGA
jgi:hypothetical protein